MGKKRSPWMYVGIGIFGVVSLSMLGLFIYLKSTGQL